MSQITIHVSSFSKKILETRYGTEPFKISRSDEYYHHLTSEPLRQNKSTYVKINKTLQQTATLQVSDTLVRRLKAKGRSVYIGGHLHKVMQANMLNFVEAQVLAGLPAQRALKNFLDHYNITEDDYSLETAYTAWKRFKSVFYPKTREISATFWSNTDPQKRVLCCKVIDKPVPREWVVKCVNDLFEIGYVNLLCKSLSIRTMQRVFTYHYDESLSHKYLYPRRLLAYLLYTKSKMTVRQISRLINRDFSTIWRHIQQIKFEATVYKQVTDDLACLSRSIDRLGSKALDQ